MNAGNEIYMIYDTLSGGSLGLKNSVSNDKTIFRVMDPGARTFPQEFIDGIIVNLY
ncbi:hypothetical protein M405DRAFT_812087 [Rhizopogon salebrosus TDB-379]|nr:hypothetical protein M405DRAFT_812087 [Rhizopogon salebrosus TDB-379]